MARKLKTFTTSAGFFDLAVAAPSMKAALEAWGADGNLFRDGFAKVSDDPKAIAATMERPGVVLRRPVGSDDAYSEDSALPKNLPVRRPERPAKRIAGGRTPRAASGAVGRPPSDKRATKKASDTADSHATLAFEKEERRRRHEQRKEEQARTKERRRHDRAVAKVQAALDKASRAHDERIAEIEKAQAALDGRVSSERTRWQKQRRALEKKLKQARE
jgi:colicin import membrane protein